MRVTASPDMTFAVNFMLPLDGSQSDGYMFVVGPGFSRSVSESGRMTASPAGEHPSHNPRTLSTAPSEALSASWSQKSATWVSCRCHCVVDWQTLTESRWTSS